MTSLRLVRDAHYRGDRGERAKAMSTTVVLSYTSFETIDEKVSKKEVASSLYGTALAHL